MTEHKLKITNKLHGAFFTRGSWHSCSGMTDIILKCAEEGQTRLKLVGPSIRDYALSTSYFLGQRPDMTLELCSLPSYSDSCPDSLLTTVLPGGTKVTSMLISPLPPRPKRPHSEISTTDDGPSGNSPVLPVRNPNPCKPPTILTGPADEGTFSGVCGWPAQKR